MIITAGHFLRCCSTDLLWSPGSQEDLPSPFLSHEVWPAGRTGACPACITGHQKVSQQFISTPLFPCWFAESG